MSVLEGRLVALRPPEPDDAAAVYAYINHPVLIGRRHAPEGFPVNLPLSRRDVDGILDKWQRERKDPGYVVALRTSGEIVGHATMGWGWDPLCPDAEVVIDPDLWWRGYGSDALRVMLAYLFGYTPALSASSWLADWNTAGLSFAARHGYQAVGRVRRVAMRDGVPYDAIFYDLPRNVWRERLAEGEDGT